MANKLTGRQRREVAVLKHFTPESLTGIPILDQDVSAYFDWSDRGVGNAPGRVAQEARGCHYTGLSALFFSKRNRDLSIASYQEDWGTLMCAPDFMDEPKEVAEFIAKSLDQPSLMPLWHEHNDKKEIVNG